MVSSGVPGCGFPPARPVRVRSSLPPPPDICASSGSPVTGSALGALKFCYASCCAVGLLNCSSTVCRVCAAAGCPSSSDSS